MATYTEQQFVDAGIWSMVKNPENLYGIDENGNPYVLICGTTLKTFTHINDRRYRKIKRSVEAIEAE